MDLIKSIQEGVEIEACIPENLSGAQLKDMIFECGRQITRLTRYERPLKFAFGRMMLMASQSPTFLDENGYNTFDDFRHDLSAYTGMERATLYSWRPIAEQLPNLTRKQLDAIPHQSLKVIARHVPESKRDEMLQVAESTSYEKFKKIAEDRGMLGPGEADGAQMILSGTKAQIKELRQYVERADVQEFVGTSNIAEILMAMVWEVQGDDGWPSMDREAAKHE